MTYPYGKQWHQLRELWPSKSLPHFNYLCCQTDRKTARVFVKRGMKSEDNNTAKLLNNTRQYYTTSLERK